MKRHTLLLFVSLVALATALPRAARAQASLGTAVKAYNDGNFGEAAFRFYDVAAYDPVLENRFKAEYFLAETLQKMGLERSAAFYYTAIVRQGTNHPYYLKAIAKLVQIAEDLRDDVFIPTLIERQYNSAFSQLPAATLYKINYLVGLQKFRRNDARSALQYLAAVPRESSYYDKALYLTGIIKTFQSRAGGQEAVEDYKDILELKDGPKVKYWDLANTKQLATLAIARTDYTLGRYGDAKRAYEQIPRYSTYWDVALFEDGWASFMAEDIGTAMGSLHTLQAPQFAGSFQPESVVLKATVYFTACLYDEVQKELKVFDQRYKPMAAVVDKIVKAHPNDSDLPLFLALVATPQAQKPELPLAVRNKLLDNHRVQSLIHYVNVIDDESAKAKTIDVWKGSNLLHEIESQLSKQREQFVLTTGKFIRGRLEKLVKQVGNLDGQAEILRFETSKAEKEMLESGVDPKTRLKGETLLRPTMPGDDWQYWSFDGEWWVDELGYYKYTLKSACSTGQGAGGGAGE